MGCAAPVGVSHTHHLPGKWVACRAPVLHTTTHRHPAHRVSKCRENRPGFFAGETPDTAKRVSKRRENRPGFRAGETPERAERVSKCREKRGRVIPLGQPHTGRIARVGRFFPKSASCFQSRPFLERVGRFFPESASCFQSRPASPFLSAGAAVQRPSGSARQAAELLRSPA